MKEIIKQIKKDLDAGMFNKICSNESTFLSYVQQKLFAFQEADDTHIRLGDVSAWIEYGKKNGYLEYFEQKIKDAERLRIWKDFNSKVEFTTGNNEKIMLDVYGEEELKEIKKIIYN
jgi:hypothetical protein